MQYYEIFGKKVKIENFVFNSKEYKILQEWLKHYRVNNDKLKEDIVINIVEKININYDEFHYNSPTDYKVFKNGFVFNLSGHLVYIKKENNILKIDIQFNCTKNKLKKFLQKFKSIGFVNCEENIGAFFYEMILVYSQYLFEDRALIHASAVKSTTTNDTILFGGSGGVGKTSLEILLCMSNKYKFLADDISVIDNKGYIYPNFAYPKIYAYNLENIDRLKMTIFQNRTFLDKFQWKLRLKLKGAKGVRRAIDPAIIYNIEKNRQKITKYFHLVKTNEVENIQIEVIDNKDLLSKAVLNIIQNEYGCDTIHYNWEAYNSLFMNKKPLVDLNELYNRWFKIYNDIFSNINTYIIKIPINISHKEFLRHMENYFIGENN